MENNSREIQKVVITGGPCSGKSTGISRIADRLLDSGRIPLIIPETPTELHAMGIFDLGLGNEQLQEIIVKYQIKAEEQTEKIAKMLAGVLRGKEPIILQDRGIGDGRAYIDHARFDYILKRCGFDQGITDIFGRYGIVVHLDTAPAEYYTTENNDARSEDTRDKAMKVNFLTENARLGFPHRRKITNNYASFDEKIQAATNEITHYLGDPEVYEREEKFEVAEVDISLFEKNNIRIIESNVEQDYLLNTVSDTVRRVRRRGWAPGCRIYTYTEKDRATDIEHDKNISLQEYSDLLQEKDLTRTTLKKKRYNFTRNGHYFELDYFLTGKKKGKRLLEIEKSSKEQKVELPSFLNIIAQVDWKNEEMVALNY